MNWFCCFRKKNKLINEDDDKVRILDKMRSINVFVTDEEERVTELTNTSINFAITVYEEDDERIIAELMNSIVGKIERI
jgi:hypothetical protein